MTKDEKAAYWRQQIGGFQASGLSAKNYCAQEGIAVGRSGAQWVISVEERSWTPLPALEKCLPTLL